MSGRVSGKFHIDVGIGDALHGTPERLLGDDLLAFAGIAPAQALAIPRAQQFSEKIHAYTYPWSDRMNTRTKDLVDLLLLLDRDSPAPEDVRAALTATFSARKTHVIPNTLPEPPESWSSEFAAMAAEVQLSVREIQTGFEELDRYWVAHCAGSDGDVPQ